MQFSELKNELETVAIKVGDATINVKQYLPINEKYDLIMSTTEQSFMDGIFNPVKQEMSFNINLIYLYTDIEFTEDEKLHPAAVYDTLETNGILNAVIAAIPAKEMSRIYTLLDATVDEQKAYNKSVIGSLKSFFVDMPEVIKEAGEQLDAFDVNKYENVVNMAKAIGAKI